VNDVDDFDYLQAEPWPPPADPRVTRYDRSGEASRTRPGRPGSANGTPAPGYPPVNGRHSPGYSPANGRHAPGYLSVNGQPGPGYPPANGRHSPGYSPANGRHAPGYPPANGRPGPGYPPVNVRPGPGYPPVNGRPGPEEPGLIRRAAPEEPALAGKRILGWLPFGNRLVLLPKGLPFDGEDQDLREHRDVSGGWLRPAVFGAMDGLVTNSSLIAGIGGGGGGGAMIVLTGIAGLIAGAFSMATGEYISVTSQNELTAAEVELERMQHLRDPRGKLDRLTEVFIEKGVSPNLAEAVVRQISADPDRAVATHVREELGIDPDDMPSPRTAALASFAAFTVGALIPLSPFLLGYPVLKVALAMAGVAAFLGGAAVAKLTERSVLAGGLRQFVAAFLATGMAFAVGHLIGGRIT
jgi:VIT1/CCC1 family predicted Fe2+/Mn2+ transporter